MGPQKYLRRSLETVCGELEFDLCPATLSRLLYELGYRLRVNEKSVAGPPHPDRDPQFLYLQEQLVDFLDADLPVISVDTKKKELVGNFKQPGRKWERKPEPVNDHDFPSDAIYKAVPYGVYDILHNRGYVNVGISHDTPAFAVSTIAGWWARFGCKRYRGADELLILADSGGSNGCRPRLWKAALQEQIADRYGLEVTVCHYPRGASKYNPIEHRLFGPISINWAGQPLRTLDLLLRCIAGVRTHTGLRADVHLDPRTWEAGIKITADQMATLNLHRHDVCPDWNYTIKPRQHHQLN